ncbi:kinase-like protein [Auricularia subglabra TFB-10046 SS5]|nr:kinase-like protein [Auricularia subglabra TFB-10046 SS5]
MKAVDISPDFDNPSRTPRTIGPFTEVYRLQHRQLGLVALKRIRYDADDEELPKGLRKECARLLEVDHKNILPVLGVCDWDGIGVVAEWQENGDVVAYLKKNPETPRLPLLAQVAEGLAHLHSLGLVHGNLHPRNILISSTGTARITEYCMIEHVPDENSGSMRPSFLREKVVFVAPEINSGASRSPRTDVYSFGMLIFYAYCERPPMADRPGAIQAVAALMSGERPKKDEIKRADFSKELWELASLCWAQDPATRPEMPEVRNQLSRVT